MVLLHIKRADESLFLYETTVNTNVDDVLEAVIKLYNRRLKVFRICSNIEMLSEHGAAMPVEMHGLTDDQIVDLKLKDDWIEKCTPSGGFSINKDPCGRRNGHQPTEKMQEVLRKTMAEAKGLISKELVTSNKVLSEEHTTSALDILSGAVTIVYPMGLPPHDPIRLEFENDDQIAGTHDEKLVLTTSTGQLWFAGKELLCGKKLLDYVGKNEKSKVIVKLQKRGQGAPGREPIMSEEERKALMMAEFKRREEIKKLTSDDNDSYLNSEWADNQQLKKSFQGLNNITWRPR